ncbi:hypothetical protein pb186bvf_020094 [Paramecium bursaria]
MSKGGFKQKPYKYYKNLQKIQEQRHNPAIQNHRVMMLQRQVQGLVNFLNQKAYKVQKFTQKLNVESTIIWVCLIIFKTFHHALSKDDFLYQNNIYILKQQLYFYGINIYIFVPQYKFNFNVQQF